MTEARTSQPSATERRAAAAPVPIVITSMGSPASGKHIGSCRWREWIVKARKMQAETHMGNSPPTTDDLTRPVRAGGGSAPCPQRENWLIPRRTSTADLSLPWDGPTWLTGASADVREAWRRAGTGDYGRRTWRMPNLFILGAAKCGTSSLHALLEQHPDIHAGKLKEPTFFCWPYQRVRDPVVYLKLFRTPSRYRMEASHAYFSNPDTAAVLKAFFPDARFVVTLRAPKARAFSLYRHMRRIHAGRPEPHENIACFSDALAAEEARYYSRDFFVTCPQYFWNFMYCRSSMFDEQLARYFSLFKREQFHVLTLAELAADPARETGRIIAFLGLDAAPIERFTFRKSNRDGPHEPYGAEAEAIMAAAFEGLTDRVDRLVGRTLDWRL